jgi:PAS domain S-box-containing protein
MENIYYKTIIKKSPNAIAIHKTTVSKSTHNLTFICIETNEAFLNLFGFDSSAHLDQNYFDSMLHFKISDDSTWEKLLTEAWNNESASSVIDLLQTKSRALLNIQKVDDEHLVTYITVFDNKNKQHKYELSEFAVVENIKGIAVQGYKPDGTVFYWNKASEELYGYTKNEALNQNLMDLIIPESMHLNVKNAIDEMFRSGKCLPAEELYLKHKNGHLIPVFSNHFITKGHEKKLYCIDIDLSKLRQAEKMLQILSTATEQSPTSIVITDLSGSIQYVNPKFCELTGYTFEEATGKNPNLLNSGLTPPETYDQLWQTITSGDEWHGEFINKKKNGELYYESAVISPIRDENDNITNFVGVKEDITNRILVQREVMKNNNNLAALLEVCRNFSSTLEIDKLLRIIVDDGAELFNLDTASIYSFHNTYIHLETSYPPPHEDIPECYRLAPINEHPNIRKCITHQSTIYIEDTEKADFSEAEKNIVSALKLKSILYLPLLSKNETYGVLILGLNCANKSLSKYDIDLCQTMASLAALAIQNANLYSQLEQHTLDLEQQNSQLENLNKVLASAIEKAQEGDRLKAAFLQNLSHEIRTPMNGIMGFSELLKIEGINRNRQLEYLSYINESTQQLLSIVEDILDISKLEVGDIVLRNEPIHIPILLRELYQSYQNKVSEDVNLSYSCNLNEPDQDIITDGHMLKQILDKLLSNAIKFTQNGKIHFGCNKNDSAYLFFVEDTGIGIQKEQIPFIFKPFYQADMGNNRVYGGNGLGLTIASRIVEKMEGNMQVESTPDVGSTFSFAIKQKDPQQETANKETFIFTANKKDIYTILVAEDDDVNFCLVQDFLLDSTSGSRLNVLRASNGQEAIALVRQKSCIDLILMDIKMPIMDGLEATRIIKKQNPNLPIVAQTAYALTSEKEKTREAGCDGYLSKPLELAELRKVIHKFLPLS